jgi:hypothetical protein
MVRLVLAVAAILQAAALLGAGTAAVPALLLAVHGLSRLLRLVYPQGKLREWACPFDNGLGLVLSALFLAAAWLPPLTQPAVGIVLPMALGSALAHFLANTWLVASGGLMDAPPQREVA